MLFIITVEGVTRHPPIWHMHLTKTGMLVLAHTPISLELIGKTDI